MKIKELQILPQATPAIKKQREVLCALWGWTELELIEHIGEGPYVIYGGAKQPFEPRLFHGILELYDATLPFNGCRVSALDVVKHTSGGHELPPITDQAGVPVGDGITEPCGICEHLPCRCEGL